MSELGSLLKMLDHETLSQATTDQMASVRNILDSLQLSGTPMRGAWARGLFTGEGCRMKDPDKRMRNCEAHQ